VEFQHNSPDLRRDVAGYMRVENIAGFNNLVRLLASQVGAQVNRTELGERLRLDYLDIGSSLVSR